MNADRSDSQAADPQAPDPPLAEHEALMMAYVDDELQPEDRRRFESMMAADPGLAAEIADYQTMLELGRATAALEPTDRELRRFWSRFHNRAEWRLGWTLLLGGLAVLTCFGMYECVISDSLPTLVKVATLSVIAGGAILGFSILRQRRTQLRLDRYRGVTR